MHPSPCGLHLRNDMRDDGVLRCGDSAEVNVPRKLRHGYGFAEANSPPGLCSPENHQLRVTYLSSTAVVDPISIFWINCCRTYHNRSLSLAPSQASSQSYNHGGETAGAKTISSECCMPCVSAQEAKGASHSASSAALIPSSAAVVPVCTDMCFGSARHR